MPDDKKTSSEETPATEVPEEDNMPKDDFDDPGAVVHPDQSQTFPDGLPEVER